MKVIGRTGENSQFFASLAMVVVTIVVSGVLDSAYWHHNFLLVNLFVAVAVLQNMLLSDAGQVSFGQGAIFGLAAYTVGIVTAVNGQPLWMGFAVGIVFAVLLGLAYALPSLRVQGYYLGFVSLSAAVVFPELLVAFDAVTKGINGITITPTAITVPFAGKLMPLSLLIMAFVCAVIFLHRRLRASVIGRRMRVASVSPEAAQTLGIGPGHMRFFAFLMAALGTGVAGVLYTPLLGFVSPYAFRVELSMYFFFAVIVGGSGRVLGPVVGAWLLYLIPNVLLVDLADYRLLGYGIAALFIMLVFPDGVVGSLERFIRSRRPPAPTATISIAAAKTIVALPQSEIAHADMSPSIEVRGATKRFGNVAALNAIDLTIARGAIHGIVGPNGSGKTTLLNAFSGLIRLDSGTIRIHGQDIGRLPPHRIPALGVARTFQTPRIFDDLSIWDNVTMGAESGHGATAANPVLTALEPVRTQWQALSSNALQHAQRRLLEVLRASAMQGDIVLLDEPAAGLAPDERNELAGMLILLRERLGKTVVLIEHDLSLVWRVADRISVLDAGVLVAEGAPAAIRSDPRVRALFTGERDA
ncbi:MAG: ATP-binding cassette domain-containing protein [Alphaproteobacteria bacterium]